MCPPAKMLKESFQTAKFSGTEVGNFALTPSCHERFKSVILVMKIALQKGDDDVVVAINARDFIAAPVD